MKPWNWACYVIFVFLVESVFDALSSRIATFLKYLRKGR